VTHLAHRTPSTPRSTAQQTAIWPADHGYRMVPLSLFCRLLSFVFVRCFTLIDDIHGQQDADDAELVQMAKIACLRKDQKKPPKGKILPTDARLSRYPTIRHHRFPASPASSFLLRSPFPHPSFRLYKQTTGKFNLMIDRMLAAAAGGTSTPRS
jgi:hypothetical protein